RNDKGKGKGKGKKEEVTVEKYGETWEQPRDETGLKLIGDMAPPGVRWDYVLKDESRRAFAAYLPSPFSTQQCDELFFRVKEGTEWKQPQSAGGYIAPRKTAWMTKKGCACTYKYGGMEVDSQEFPPWMTELLRMSMHYCGIAEQDWPDSCNMNLYEDGGSSVGWHSDDEQLFQGKFVDIRIVSLSFGQKRKFELRMNEPEQGESKNPLSLSLGSGDLMTMEGMTQKHFIHRVPKEKCEGPRINLTWRWVLKHTPRCPAGRHRR
ncbi:unnamed protein product, partial [Polarella glacialis]